ncbi:hypothetical protein BC777_0692 [Yoonia maricola]|uniref:Uncharacterized protein n=1 Tax=Yoonia maricola TaxID=420999 RepID=A0A2M8WLP7_9RHOB|nr:hypothetical protein [Yoonia maricola]PJI91851.1 hypothetical protein BC777_0692 [Yoonia maricola]
MTLQQSTIFDTNDEFSWESIQTTVDTDTGLVVSTRTLFDIGNEVIATFENGILVRDINLGTIETVGFTNRFTEYDMSGQPTSIGTVYADDLRVTESFENGIRTQTLLQDGFFGDGAKPWAEITLTHDAEGNIATRTTKLDNGLISLDIFLQGVSETRYDYSQTKNWDFIDTTFDGNGARISENVVYDNGVVQMTDFSDGVRISSERDDIADVFSWETITTLFDFGGAISERETIFDDGVTKFEEFDNGIRTSMTQFDNVGFDGVPAPDGGAKTWQEIYTSYDENGEIDTRETIFDDGVTKFEEFDNGVRASTTQFDNVGFDGVPAPDGGAKTWQEIYTSYDENGEIDTRETVFDNGVTKFEEFDNGVRASTTQFDNVGFDGVPAPDGGAKTWQEIYTSYDENGEIDTRETVFDNGVTKFEEFDNGVRASTTQFDNVGFDGVPAPDGGAKTWQEIYTSYDENGEIDIRETVFDNGLHKLEVFDAGQKYFMAQADVDDIKSWDEILTEYDQNGQITQRTTTFDDGGEKFEEFDAGQRVSTIQQDTFNFKNWDTQQTVYDDNGNVSFKGIEFDDSGATFEIFDAGVLTAFLEFDSEGLHDPNSENWAARLTEYGADGPVTTSYDNPLDLSPEYFEYLLFDFA